MRSDCSYILVDESVHAPACKVSSAPKTLNHRPIKPDAGMASVLTYTQCLSAYIVLLPI